MMHFSCDFCGKDMTPEGTGRYVLKMEAFAANDPNELTEDDLETDHVEEMAQMLSEMEEADGEAELLPVCRRCGSTSAPAASANSSTTPSAASASKFDFSPN